MQDNEKEIENSFYEHITFGTGGMRGKIGPGINRMNIYTIRKAVEGLAYYLKENRVNYQDRGVVIAYDSRYQSKKFALEAAKVLGAHGIKSYIFKSLSPTPLLSFAVRYLGTGAGIMITASHNPPEYNGFKVYNESGSQVSLEEANQMIHFIERVEDVFTIPVHDEERLIVDNLLQLSENEIDSAYLEQLGKITKMDAEMIKQQKKLSIVFTPLHGTAQKLVQAGLKQLNINNIPVIDEQIIHD